MSNPKLLKSLIRYYYFAEAMAFYEKYYEPMNKVYLKKLFNLNMVRQWIFWKGQLPEYPLFFTAHH
ncbi:hypothetical protein NYE44_00990 [Paenibacillus sp. FSL L8-0493]|uniref:hypothetical protein n=1 Tax=Paenibacillus TaxID=44249 RepID=UPI00096C9499|nr:hypothetical protein [Paenibacillus odorifer]OMD07909.1 hypothetical protein BJP47_09510 [Paenibacillus odorifer]OMD31811.1 hypothetical protein BJP48_14520 [Paenibacillus odorifer]